MAKGLLEAIEAASKAGTLKMSIQIGWTHEPIDRAGKLFEKIWSWLETIEMADWDRIDAAARHFHPDYRLDQKTRELMADRAQGATVYLQMERGEYSPKLLQLLAPTIAATIPIKSRSRRAPTRYLIAVLVVSSCLAAHEFDQLQNSMEAKPLNLERIARHLYFFERFTALFARTVESKPPSVELNTKKRRDASAWRQEVLSFHDARQKRHRSRRVSAKESASEWAKGRHRPSPEVAYRALLKELRSREEK
jgi:hypothetical protein